MAGLSFGSGVGGMLFGGGAANASAEPVHVGGGKNAHAVDMGTPHTGMKNTLTKGDPLARSMGHYGKKSDPLSHIRGGMGGMKRIRGGLGPGKLGTAGASDKDYSMKNTDLE
jgi:hypothetical protein